MGGGGRRNVRGYRSFNSPKHLHPALDEEICGPVPVPFALVEARGWGWSNGGGRRGAACVDATTGGPGSVQWLPPKWRRPRQLLSGLDHRLQSRLELNPIPLECLRRDTGSPRYRGIQDFLLQQPPRPPVPRRRNRGNQGKWFHPHQTPSIPQTPQSQSKLWTRPAQEKFWKPHLSGSRRL